MRKSAALQGKLAGHLCATERCLARW